MWALIKDNKIEEIIARPKDMVIDDIRHSRRIFTAWTWDELNAIGIYTVESGTQGDDRFEITSQPTYTFDNSNKKVTTKYTTTDKALDDAEAKDEDGKNILDDDGNKIINYGLKTLAKNLCKSQANELISRFNWLVERSIYDSSKAIPDAVKTYVAAIRTDCSDIETAITNASDMTAFKALYADELNSDGSIKTVNRINRWTSDSTVTDYIR
jgi:hypothetical protein|tara:strand:+ start:1307 stop:1942 length:636 start_codon:yes stop_codon:yes gene_type:complete